MSQPRLAALALLGLATVTAAGLALQQYRRAEALAARLAQAQNLADASSSRSAATGTPADIPAPSPANAADSDAASLSPDASMPDASDADPSDDRRERRSNRGNPAAIMDKLMQNPEFAEAMRLQQNAHLDSRYAALFAQLNLPPAQLAQLKDLLSERQNVRRDVFTAARAEGLGRGNREEIRDIIQATQDEIDADIRSTIGAQAFATLERYEQTDNERRLVSSLADRLSYSGSPLNPAQSDALVTLLAETGAIPGGAAVWAGELGPGGRISSDASNRTTAVTDEVIARAQGILSPDQLDALRAIQAEQQAAQAVRDAMRNEFRANAGNRRETSGPPGG